MKLTQLPAVTVILLMGLCTAAMAGPIYTFSTSTGVQPSDVGVVTLTQNGADAVDVKVDLINSTYGFMNTGGPHTPFAFNLAGSGAVSINFTTPVDGGFAFGNLSLNLSGGNNTPYGAFTVAIDSSAGNGSSKAYFGDLVFTLARAGGLSTEDFVANALGAYFSADLTDGRNTGAQAWKKRDRPAEVPEPQTLALIAAGMATIAAMRRRRKLAVAIVRRAG